MARYRIVIEIDVPIKTPREKLNSLAQKCANECTLVWSIPVYVSTERVEVKKDVLKS